MTERAPRKVTAPRREIRRGYVDLSDGQMHLLTAAGTDPAIILLHQTASAATTYQPLMATFPAANRLIALDTPGFGGSFDPPGWPSMDAYADYVVQTADKLKARRFYVVGHHTGASLAIALALRHPRLVRGIVLIGPVPMDATERKAFRRSYGVPVRPKADGSHLLHFWNYAYANNRGADLALIHAEVNNMSRAWRGRAQAYRAVSFHDSMKALRGVTCPILLVSCRGDFFHDRFDCVRALRPDAAVAIIGGQNFPMQTHPGPLGRAIAAFVRRVETG